MTTDQFVTVVPHPATAWATIDTPDYRLVIMDGTDNLPVYARPVPGVPTNDVIGFGNTVTVVLRYELDDPDNTDPVIVDTECGDHAGRITALAWITATFGAMT